ncbi:MAG: hypothetical protein KIT84_26540 [Labilithrix sp.]|nr:hypothetical protein [Labilithrix sp.]MCW5814612.1 hypothetical protein [Labilithrix sp.]
MTRKTLGCLILAAGIVACDDDKKGDEASKVPPPPEQGGVLGAARFRYKCLLPSDAQCDFDKELGTGAGGSSSSLPTLATGSRFGLEIELNASAGEGDAPALTALHPTFATVEADGVTLVRPGKTTIGLSRGADIVDMLDVEVKDPTGIKLFSGDPQGQFTDVKVGVGSVKATVQFTFRFRAALADGDQVLAGSVPCKWTTSDAEIANITTEPEDNIVTVVTGTKQGTATIKVELGTFSTEIPLTVGG